MSKNVKIAWIAGLLEGEGYFCLNRNRLVIQLNMCDADVLHKYKSYLIDLGFNPKANIIKLDNRKSNKNWKPTHKDIYHFEVGGVIAKGLMRLILPYMGDRRSQKIKQVLAERLLYENNNTHGAILK